VFQAGYQANQITGDLSLVGPVFLQLLLREFGPTITAMMIATRVGTGMAAHIGSMVVTEQVDALRMSSAPPIDYLVVPRFLAS
ncbi:MAG: MlaE family ABC transporter permease, partial [Bradymonadaceae bacterium]